MTQQKRTHLVMGALLHDIGKVIQRNTQQRVKHAQLGADFIKQFNPPIEIEQQIKYHHYDPLQNANLEKNNLTYLTYYADNLSSGTDRRNIDGESNASTYSSFDTWTNQADIFNHFKGNIGHRYHPPMMLDDRNVYHFARSNYREFNAGDYGQIVDRLTQGLAAIEFNTHYETSLLDLLESTLSFVPSSTNLEESRDISLFDHSKLTAALALAMFHYFEEQEINDYSFLRRNHSFDETQAFLLFNFDISGIQDFIYTIRDKQAAKMLRSRSFYLEMLAENVIHQLIKRLELSRTNLIYSGGGGAYLILPNTQKAVQVIHQVEKEINDFLREIYGTALYIAFGYAPFSGQIVKDNKGAMGQVYMEVSHIISQKKLNRYSAVEIVQLNRLGKKIGRECDICHRIHESKNNSTCSICEGLIDFSRNLQKQDFFEVSSQKNKLPLGFGEYLHTISEENILTNQVNGRIYSKNKFYTGKYQATHLWVGDYATEDTPTYNDYVDIGTGIKRLGVVRCDVDDLGNAFISGFSEHFQTLSRTATLSRSLSLFFQHYINLILAEERITGSIIYAGGDDVFVVGDWYDMIQFAINLRQKFIQFTQGKLTLSTGIGLFPAKTPISIMAKQTGRLESAAKTQFSDKDAITLFDPAFTLKWDDFIKNVWEEKFELIDRFIINANIDDSYGKVFIYKLLELIRQSFEEAEGHERGKFKTISWAHWVYYLTRMEPTQPEAKEIFREFSEQLHLYFMDEKEVRELELALLLYIYTIRGDE